MNPLSKAAGFEMYNQGSVFFRAGFFIFHHPIANDRGAYPDSCPMDAWSTYLGSDMAMM